MDDFRVRNTAVLAMTLGVGISDVVRLRRGSPVISRQMGSDNLASSNAVNESRGILTRKINEKLSSLRQSIEAIGEVPERGVSILNIFRRQEIPVMTLLDELREMPANEDPVLYLIDRGFPKDFLEKLGLHEGMSKGECQEILSRHFQEILEKVGVESGVRNVCKLAVNGEDHYRKRSAGLKLASTITRGISDIAAKPMVWMARGVVSIVAKSFGIDPSKLPETQTVKAVTAVAIPTLAICIPLCPPLAIAVGVMFGVFLLFKGTSSILESVDKAFVRSRLEGKDDGWNQFCSNLSQKILETMDDVAPAAMAALGVVIPGTTGQILAAAAEETLPETPEDVAAARSPVAVPVDRNPPAPTGEASPTSLPVPPVVIRLTVPDVD
jgi:hypothetical protein